MNQAEFEKENGKKLSEFLQQDRPVSYSDKVSSDATRVTGDGYAGDGAKAFFKKYRPEDLYVVFDDPSAATSGGLLDAKDPKIYIDCKGVTFKLKELGVDIDMDEAKLRKLLDETDALVINGVKFAKAT